MIKDSDESKVKIEEPPKLTVKAKRGRKKANAIGEQKIKKCKRFVDLTEYEKVVNMLKWLDISEDTAKNITCGEYEIKLKDFVNLTPHNLRDSFDNIDISSISNYVSERGFTYLGIIKEIKQELNLFKCNNCKKQTDNQCIACDACNFWYHYKCVGLDEQKAEKLGKKSWFCDGCQDI